MLKLFVLTKEFNSEFLNNTKYYANVRLFILLQKLTNTKLNLKNLYKIYNVYIKDKLYYKLFLI